jgi:tetratricopeptide (TPR) repeat protein
MKRKLQKTEENFKMTNLMQQKLSNPLLRLTLVGLLMGSFFTCPNFQVKAAQIDTDSPTENSSLQQGKAAFFKGRKMFYNNEAPLAEVNDTLNFSKEALNKLPGSFDKYYWLAQVEFVAAEAAELYKENKQASKSFSASSRFIKKALHYNAKSSDANRLLVDTKMRLMVFKGPAYLMIEGPIAFMDVNKAVGYDKKNYTALNSLGVYYLNAPIFGGGNTNWGINMLKKALESKDEFDNFISYAWLGKAYQKKRNIEESTKYYNKALEIYPNSQWIEFLKGYSIWSYSSHR